MARKPSAGVNLTRLAGHLGISVSTASRAIRNADGICRETRARVLEAARKIGYDYSRRNAPPTDTPPHHIMALAQCSTPRSDQNYLSGMSRASIALNLAILSHHVTVEDCASVLDPKWQPAAMRTGLVEGIVLIHRWPPEVALQLSQRWPTVSIIHHYPGTTVDHIGIDDRSAVAKLVARLRAAGHTRIGFFGPCREMSWACSRFSAYVEAVVREGLPYEPKDVIEITFHEALAPSIFARGAWADAVIARLKAGVDAWVCSSAVTAFTLCRYLLDRQIRVPEAVSITGYHRNIAQPANLPLVTSIDVKDEELGAAALRRLLHRFSHPEESQRLILLPAVYFAGETIRQNAAPAPAR